MKILAIFAHIDDHICFGWPLMQDEKVEKHLIVCTNDGDGVLQISCHDAEINLIDTLGLPNGFYRQVPPHHCAEQIFFALQNAIKEMRPDFLFSHNPWGEYGHFDHRMLFEIAYSFLVPLLVTDILVRSFSWSLPSPQIYNAVRGPLRSTVTPDDTFYAQQSQIFRRAGNWTQNPYLDRPHYPKQANIYETVKNEK